MKLFHFILIALLLASLQRCATQITPTGGPKDSVPPILITSLPEANSKNFHGKTVALNFSEFIKIKDQKEIIITPRPGKDITILAKNKTVTIEPKNGWADSTTYSINFREAVQDITESLPARNLHLAFSTGPIIDSLSVSGTVHFSLKETLPEKVTVAIYQSDTFNIFKHQPDYFTETSKEGKFKIDNLKPGNYRIYAFDDKNKNLKVDSQSELYGFASDSVHLSTNAEKLHLYLIRVDSRKLRVSNVRHNSKLSKIKLNKGTVSYRLTPVDSIKPINNYGDNQSEIDMYHWEGLIDSAAMHLTATDSLGITIDTTVYIKFSAGKAIKEKFAVQAKIAQYTYETGQLTVGLQYTLPLKKIEDDTIQINFDSTLTVRIHRDDISIDTIRKKASFYCFASRKTLELFTSPLQLYVSKNVFISIEGDSSKEIRAPIPFLKEAETGQLEVQVKTEAPHFIIQLLNPDYTVQQETTKKEYTFKNLPPANYKIRAILDSNNNGVWDPGNIFLNKEPEKIFYLKNVLNDKFDFPLRADWTVGPYVFPF